jgi:hypothetical protein
LAVARDLTVYDTAAAKVNADRRPPMVIFVISISMFASNWPLLGLARSFQS